MKRVIAILAFLQYIGLLQVNAYTLFDSGRSTYRIVVADGASTTERYAADELQYWLQQVGGAKLSIVGEQKGTQGRRILVGYGNEVKPLVKAARPKADDQGFVYGNVGGDLYIYGGKEIGTLYGVYSFLENEMGCRWYTKDFSFVPRKKKYEFDKLYDKEEPAFLSRDLYYYDSFDAKWTLRNKTHGRKNSLKTSQALFRFPAKLSGRCIPSTNFASRMSISRDIPNTSVYAEENAPPTSFACRTKTCCASVSVASRK